MEGIFLEFENENALRAYPFAGGRDPSAEGSAIPDGVFIDAAIYPVNPSGTVYLSSVSEDGLFSVSDGTGVIMTGRPDGASVEFTDLSGLSRPCGVLCASSVDALSEFAHRGYEMRYTADQAAFAASCLFPVSVGGVTSITVGGAGPAAGDVSFVNGADDEVRVSSGTLEDGRKTLRFDVLPRPSAAEDLSVRRVICVVDGQTPFRISKLAPGSNTVALQLEGIDREDVCAAAHRELSFMPADTCSCGEGEDGPCDKSYEDAGEPLPETYQLEEVFVPPTSENADGAENAFYLVVPNEVGYANPLSITLEDGVVSPKTTEPEVVVNGMGVELAEGETMDSVTSNAVIIQVPGLSGGAL